MAANAQPENGTFRIFQEGDEHGVGDESCSSGVCGEAAGMPTPCSCGGIQHGEFVPEQFYQEDNFWVRYQCDGCWKIGGVSRSKPA